ncbi:MAG: methyltransferase domain-containing protein [Myxococcota bacterium]|nr:methyltransferase domain-containing protein [Myxococcota bacterium]
MATPWDRAAAGYLDEWVPRFVPYHLDLVRELALRPGDHVLVTSAGPGAEVLAAARAVGEAGFVRATDKSQEMIRICREQRDRARLPARIECAEADASDATPEPGRPWDAILCAFGLWQLPATSGAARVVGEKGISSRVPEPSRLDALRAWAAALAPNGKVGIITWGPSDPGEPFAQLGACLSELEPACAVPDPHVEATRDAMASMFEEAGLVMVRHTVVRHTLGFKTAEAFVRAMREACTWRRVSEELGDARLERVAARFYERHGGPDKPISFDPPATLAIAALPGAQIELEHRVTSA